MRFPVRFYVGLPWWIAIFVFVIWLMIASLWLVVVVTIWTVKAAVWAVREIQKIRKKSGGVSESN